WSNWKWGDIDPETGKRKKPPHCAHDLRRHASSTNARTWSTFEAAVAVVEAGKADGIGFAMCAPYVFLDLDSGLTPAEREAIAFSVSSYTEESVGGEGLHVICRGNLSGGRHPGSFGVFQEARLCYFSGRRLEELPATIEDRQDELDAVLAEYLPTSPIGGTSAIADAQPVDLEDEELIEAGKTLLPKFAALWAGDWSGYDSHSQADLALCSYLAWLTGRDVPRIDRMFRASGLMRDKWNRQTLDGRFDYRDPTIETAIAGTKDVYDPKSELTRKRVPTSERPQTAYISQ